MIIKNMKENLITAKDFEKKSVSRKILKRVFGTLKDLKIDSQKMKDELRKEWE